MSDDDTIRKTGRGGLAVAGAKIYFIVLGLVQNLALKSALGVDGYGALSRVQTIASVTYNPITTMSIQAVSRSVLQAPPEELKATVRRILTWHAVFGLVVALAFAALVPITAKLFGAVHVQGPLLILSAILLIYAVYTPLIGIANGQKRFVLQAAFDVTSATLRTAGLVVGAVVAQRMSYSGPTGSAIGFVLSATVVLFIAASLIGAGAPGIAKLSLRHYAGLAWPLLLGQALLNLLMQADSLLLGRTSSVAALAAGVPLSKADELVGAYRFTQQFSFLPYQILIAITFILFPMLTGAAQQKDSAAIARYVRTGLRLSLILVGAMVSVTAGLAPRLLDLLFGPTVAELGGRALTLLALGFGAFAIFGILTTVLNSLGRERQSMWATGLAVLVVAALCFTRTYGAPLSENLLWLTAQGTSAGLVVATTIAALLVYRAAGALVSPWTLLRTVLSLGAAAFLARSLFPAGKLLTLVAAAITPIVYFILLVLTRELTRADLDTLRKVARR
jgi:stage V sporulation protein B